MSIQMCQVIEFCLSSNESIQWTVISSNSMLYMGVFLRMFIIIFKYTFELEVRITDSVCSTRCSTHSMY